MMLRAGLRIDIDVVLCQPVRVGLLAVVPCLVEVAFVTLLSSIFFSSGDPVRTFDWRWGALLGFCLADVSPALVFPQLLKFQQRLLGARRGVPSVLMAAASMNVVVAVMGFGVAIR
jgi:hypothetical protein